MTEKATQAQARAMGFTTPQGWDYVSLGDDAITNNAQAAAGYVMQLRQAAGGDPLPPMPAPTHLEWVDVPLQPGFAYRDGRPLQVAIDGAGIVYLRGNMAETGFDPATRSAVFATLPAWAIPESEVRWMGFSTGSAGAPFGGWISSTTGDFTLYADSVSGSFVLPTSHFSIITQPWQAAAGGAATQHELRGAGVPVDPPAGGIGTRYTDTATVTGAVRWIYDGETWRVLYGDTGARKLPVSTDVATSGSVTIERQNGLVSVTITDLQLAPGASGKLLILSIPEGFRPPINANTFAIGSASGTNDPVRLLSSGGGDLRLYGAPAGAVINASFTFPATGPWPTTLPGLAVTH